MAMVFWISVGLVTVLTIFWTLYPLFKRESSAPAARASYDIQVFKDQLAEIEIDEKRGTITEAEAARVRIEVSRRLLAAAKAEEVEAPSLNAPKSATYGLAALLVLATSIGGLGIYSSWGSPGRPDLPLAVNLAQRAAAQNIRISQEDAEAIVAARAEGTLGLPGLGALTEGSDAALLAQLAEVLKDRPNDLEGHRLLTRNLASAGRFIEAHAAEDDVLRILGDAVTPEDHLEHAELMILAADSYVSSDAIAALNEVMSTIPENPRARYYAGLALAQYGKPREAYIMWNQLLQEGPENAPWIPAIRATIAELAQQAGIAAQQAPLAGPSNEQVQAASEMSDAERADMISSMVAQLSERLAADGGSVEEWVRLISTNTVLGDVDAAKQALVDAKAAFADEPAALARIEAAGAQIE
ncbi:MAG: c-type cytochrome biogenesis protein CcmI [Rhodobacteraceae bacterium]|nr:c-type cytochrome biogenesis protein CcmI [Paracoccaceae bacterium]